MKIKVLVILLAFIGISNAYDWEHSDPYELEHKEVGRELASKENDLYRECNMNWDSSTCKQMQESLIAFIKQIYPQLSQNDLKTIARVKEDRMKKWKEAAAAEKKGQSVFFWGGLGFKDSFTLDIEAAQLYEARELGRVEAHIE